MWSLIGFVVSYVLFSLFKDVDAKICSQYRGYNDIIVYISCYENCCGDLSYRYCCPSSTHNLYVLCAGVTLLGILIILIAAISCRYNMRRRGRSEGDGNNRTEMPDMPTVTQSAIYSGPPAYSPSDPLRGYSNPAFPAEVCTNFDNIKPPDYQRDPPEYEKDPPTYQSAVTNNSNNVENADNGNRDADTAPEFNDAHNAIASGSVQTVDISENGDIINAEYFNGKGSWDDDAHHLR